MERFGRTRRRPLLVGFVVLVGVTLAGGAPTLTTITVDGAFADWAGVLGNPDNRFFDGPGGGLPDADGAPPSNLNLDTVAWTWDATYLYLYIHRQASAPEFNYFWFHIDRDNDGRMETNEPILRVGWWGNNRRVDTSLDRYIAAGGAAGDAMTNGAGSHDGYKLPGNRAAGPAIETLTGGSVSGLEMEARVSWASLGLPAGGVFQLHVSSTRRLNEYPGTIRDNTGGTNAFEGVLLDPDRSAGAVPGTTNLDLPHTIANTGNLADTFDLSWTSAGAFVPVSVTVYVDADASGTLTPGDFPLTDSDGDALPDTGAMPALSAPRALLARVVIPATATVGQAATVTLRARSSRDLTVSDTAVETITIVQPDITLMKAVSAAAAPPGAPLTYTLTYTNTGTSDAITVTIVDPVPASTTYVAGSAVGPGTAISFSHDGGGSYDASEAPPVTHVRWVRGAALPPAGAGSVSFQVTVD